MSETLKALKVIRQETAGATKLEIKGNESRQKFEFIILVDK